MEDRCPSVWQFCYQAVYLTTINMSITYKAFMYFGNMAVFGNGLSFQQARLSSVSQHIKSIPLRKFIYQTIP